MSKKKYANVGGQAVMEGIMMRSPKKSVLAVRKPDGTIVTEQMNAKPASERCKFFKLPFIRGIVSFVDSLVVGYKSIMRSAELAGLEDDENITKTQSTVAIVVAVVLGFGMSLFLFMYLPLLVVKLIELIISATVPSVVQTLLAGVIRIAIFLVYLFAISQMKDIKTLFRYHGAEHKTIFCFENREELTPENVRKYSRLHPRCGTNFIFLVLIISILIYSLLAVIPGFDWMQQNLSRWLFMLVKLPFLPIIAGISFEVLRIAGRHDNLLVRIVTAPGLALQRLTTKEPDDNQIEVAIVALKESLTDSETGELDTEAAYK